MIALPPLFTCAVIGLHDGDGPIYCTNGVKVRIAGVQAPDYERAEPCRRHKPGYVCDDVLAERSKRITAQLVLGRTLSCQPVDRSHKRIVARCAFEDGRDLSCVTIAAGSAVRWDRYWRKYKMGACK